ncbi:sensor histidine kinase [Pseudoalteromonas neustonica]|uniref:sensor histidine kinase n=1 Tax=Pseudoalteromonas neustonica TaxID=1840331 RepID=UPI0007DAF5FE|nr:histidine kinase [Pseudoalteromonas neustonica]
MVPNIRHTTDWRFSTLASWLGVTSACAYYANSELALLLQGGVSGAILALLFYVLKQPNKHVYIIALTYFLLTLGLMQLTSTSLVFLHLVMFTATFSPHFSLPKILCAVVSAMVVYGATHYTRWEASVPWVTFVVWFFFCVMNWFVSRRIVESLNMHYQSRQNYKELKATQQMMGAMSAAQERQNISRELHDSLGHKLTALSINLDFAKRTANPETVETLTRCHQLSQEVLEEVREIVSTQRNNKTILKNALEALCALTPNLQCDLQLDTQTEQLPQDYGLCVLRFCQEMISNTLKHTQANHITLSAKVTHIDQQTQLIAQAYNNQPETELPKQGNGLAGLKERMAQYNGDFTQYIEQGVLINTIALPLIFNRDE